MAESRLAQFQQQQTQQERSARSGLTGTATISQYDFSEARIEQWTAPLILVIDDSPTVRKVVEVTLHRAGFSVLSFADGVAALRWLHSSAAALPALIYLNIELPYMDGYEVAHTLRGLPGLERTVIIMLSSRAGLLDCLKSRLVGARDHLSKPFKVEQLVALTRGVLATLPQAARAREEQP